METTGSKLNYDFVSSDFTLKFVPIKFFRVYDDGRCVLNTPNELRALRLLQKLLIKHDVTLAWCDDEILE